MQIAVDQQVIFGVVAAITGFLSIWYKRKTYILQKEVANLGRTVDEIRKFTPEEAKAMFQRTRWLEHHTWELNRLLDRSELEISPDEIGRSLRSAAGAVRASARDKLTDDIRVLQLAGVPLTKKSVEDWISTGFMPDWYRMLMPPDGKNLPEIEG